MEHNLNYVELNGYYYPVLDYKKDSRPIGRFGMMRMHYLQLYRPVLYSVMLVNGQLQDHLATINVQAKERLDVIIDQMKEIEGVTEEMKANNQIEWIQRMGNIHARAEEIIRHEMIYD